MTDCLPRDSVDPASLMTPDVDRLRAFADGLADEGEGGLSDLVRSVADSLAGTPGDSDGLAEAG